MIQSYFPNGEQKAQRGPSDLLTAEAKYSLSSPFPSILECLPSNWRTPFKVKYTEDLLYSQLKMFLLPDAFFTFFYHVKEIHTKIRIRKNLMCLISTGA